MGAMIGSFPRKSGIGANLRRSSKSANDWHQYDLSAYNIRVVYQNSATFFGVQDLPHPEIDNDILTAQSAIHAQHEDTFQLLQAMDEVAYAQPEDKSAYGDFATHLFRVLRYTNMAAGRFLRTRKNLFFYSCGEDRDMEIDACVMDGINVLLLVQGDWRYIDSCTPPEPQVIANAIAAFAMNNDLSIRILGHLANPLDSKVMPGITMTGTMPTFYKIPVTCDLVRAVGLGIYPPQETVVYAHFPLVPTKDQGMKPLDNRGIILSSYEAFKQFV